MGKKISIHQYFLTEADPFSQKSKLNGKAVGISAGTIIGASILVILIWGGEREKVTVGPPATDAATVDHFRGAPQSRLADQVSPGSVALSQGQSGSFYSGYGTSGHSPNSRPGAGSGTARQYNASQLVKQSSDPDGHPRDKLPVGTTIPLTLTNRVISSDTAAPVIAMVTEDVIWRDAIVIPGGTKVIGQGSLDDSSKRLQVRFTTLVFPEGEQRAVSGMGLLPDGSSGIPGDYNSGDMKKQIGRFAGTFVGGVANGMKDRQAGGTLGIPLEPGSLKNGILNGLTQSAFDQGKLYSDSLGQTKPYLSVDQGIPFLLYLEREF